MLGKQFMLIAEVGGNHEGSLKKAKELADLAIDAGAKIIKFQIYTGESLVSSVEDKNRVKHFNKFALTKAEYKNLANYIENRGAEFNASVWNEKWIDDFDCYFSFYKIGSGDLTAFPIIKKIVEKQKPIVLSTGLSTLEEVKSTVNFIIGLDSCYKNKGMLGILQCTSMYPIPHSDCNLSVINSFAKEFPNTVIGYSDHTVGTDAVKVAVSMGAEIIEVHFTDDKSNSGFRDHLVSFEANDIRDILSWKKTVDVLKGQSLKKPETSEIESGHVTSFRRAVYLSHDMNEGEVIKESDIICLRPNHGIDARDAYNLIGKKLKRSVCAHERLDFSFFE